LGTTLTSPTGQTSPKQIDRGVPDNRVTPKHGRNCHTVVLFTDVRSTLDALRCAAILPRAESAPIRLLVPQVVAYPLPLHEPAVQTSHLAQRLRTVAEQVQADTKVEILLCRDPWEAIHQALATPHLVVLGSRRRWWPTREERIAKRLRAEGHYVVLTESK